MQGTDTCTFIGGRISGSSESTTVGLWLTDYPPPSGLPTPGALARISATGFEIREFGWALRIDCDVDGVTLIGCALLNNVDGSVTVQSYGSGDQSPEVASLCLVDCRMAGGDPDQYLRVAEGCSWNGGVVAGCIFDELTAEPEGKGVLGGTSRTADVTIGAGGAGRAGAKIGGGLQVAAAAGKSASGAGGATDRVVAKLTPAPGSSGTSAGKQASPTPGIVQAGGSRQRGTPKPGPLGPKGTVKNTTLAVVDVTPCIINLAGTMTGVLVSGCSSIDGESRKTSLAGGRVSFCVTETIPETRSKQRNNRRIDGDGESR